MATSVLSRRCMARMVFCVMAAALVSALCFLTCSDGDKSTSTDAFTLTLEASPDSGGTVAAVPSLPSYKAGTKVTLTASAAVGYMFLGWQVEDEAMDTANPLAITINKDITAYAVFTRITYAVTYDANGGEGAPAAQTKTYGTALTLSSDVPEKTGYTFTGWNTLANGSGTAYAAGASYTANAAVTLYAQWVINTYAITYDAGGSTDTPAAQTKTYDIPLTLSSTTPTKTGFTFSGWNTQEDGTGTAYAAGANYTDNAAATLYAQWALITYAVTYDANGGTDPPAAQTKRYGIALTLVSEAPARTGYAFSGWNAKADGSGTAYGVGASYAENAALTLYAQWAAHTYTVTYDANGGAGAPAADSKTHDVALTLSATTPTKAGFVFAGWNTLADGAGTGYNAGASYPANANADVTLYAKWAQAYTITYDANGGSNPPAAQSKTHGVPLTLSSTPTPTKAGFAFTGWNTQEDGGGTGYAAGAIYAADASVTLYAKWTPTYTVTYNANGGTGAPNPQTKTHGIALTLSSDEPTLSNNAFIGWNTQADGQGDNYAAGASFPAEANADTTLYAQWAPANTVAYDANGGDPGSIPAAQSKIYGETLTLSAETPTRTGYTFTKWNTEDNGQGDDYDAGGILPADANADITLYAQWEINTYTVTFNSNEGSPVGPQPVVYGEKADAPTEPTRANFAFRGWYRDSEFANSWDFGVDVVTNDTVLYAKWVSAYPVTYDANGGTDEPAAQIKVHDEPLTLSSTEPTRPGHRFDGWQDGGGTGYVVTDDYTENAALTLYAQWTPVYAVVYMANSEDAENMPGNDTKVHDEPLTLSNTTPTREAYNFTGWNTVSDGNDGTAYAKGASYTDNAALTLYAQWTIKTYTVTYNLGGGTGGPSSLTQTKTHDEPFTLSNVAPTREPCYTFGNTDGKWRANTSPFTYYNPGGTYESNANVTFTALWTRLGKTLTYDANGGTNPPDPQEFPCGVQSTTTVVRPAREGHLFAGWNTQQDGNGTTYKSGGALPAKNEDYTLYAKWIMGTPPVKTQFTDNRDNTVYKKVTIGSQTWMAEDLNFMPEGVTRVHTTGSRLYTQADAQTACPTGWHLPNDAEWGVFLETIGGGVNASDKLLANGVDEFGFSATLGSLAMIAGNVTSMLNNPTWWSVETNSSWGWTSVSGSQMEKKSYTGATYVAAVRCVESSD